MIIDDLELIEVLSNVDAPIQVVYLSSPGGDLNIHAPSGVTYMLGAVSFAVGGVFGGTWTGSPTFSGDVHFGGNITIDGSLFFNSPPLTVSDGSGSITLGAADQQLFAANSNRRGLMVQNLSVADLWVNAKGGSATAGEPSIWVPPGAMLELELSEVPVNAVRIYGPVTGQAFVAEEYSA